MSGGRGGAEKEGPPRFVESFDRRRGAAGAGSAAAGAGSAAAGGGAPAAGGPRSAASATPLRLRTACDEKDIAAFRFGRFQSTEESHPPQYIHSGEDAPP